MTATNRSPGAAASIRPGDLEIGWSRIQAIMDEAAMTMIRTAFSVTIRESRDLAVVLFDRHGRALAESSIASPSFIGTLPRTLAAFLQAHPAETWSDGDLLITNDPWIGSGHLNDICMAAPILIGRRLVGYSAISAHGPDIGGGLYSALTREIYEEGICIPICHYARKGVRNPDVGAFIRANVRVPDKVIGDMEGMASCLGGAGQQIAALSRELGPDYYEAITDAIIARSEATVRDVIRKAPKGVFRSEVTASGFGTPISIKCAITVAEEGVTVDLAGTERAQFLGINVPFCYTYAHTAYPLKCVFAPRVPNNHGTLSAFTVKAPEGSILNPRRPSPVSARHLTGQYMSAAVLLALAKWDKDLVLAESAVPRPQLVFSGQLPEGRRFVEHIFLSSGMGASASGDGCNALCFPANTSCTPIEIIEALTPLRIERKELIPGSGGAGRHRGGLGQRFAVRNTGGEPIRLSILAEMTHRGAQGLFGGEQGRPARIDMDGKVLPDKAVLDFPSGSVLTVEAGGGGGFGPPSERAAGSRAADAAGGYVP
jgi:N-methylhydantoinase B